MIRTQYMLGQALKAAFFELNLHKFSIVAPPWQRLADVGSGKGFLARRAAQVLKASHLHTIDPYCESRKGRIRCPHTHWNLPIENPQLVVQLNGKVDSVTSFHAIHEAGSIPTAVANILRLFPQEGNGLLFICDYSQEFWPIIFNAKLLPIDREHYERDYANISRQGFITNEAIESCWLDTWKMLGYPDKPQIQFFPGRYCVTMTGNGPAWERSFSSWEVFAMENFWRLENLFQALEKTYTSIFSRGEH